MKVLSIQQKCSVRSIHRTEPYGQKNARFYENWIPVAIFLSDITFMYILSMYLPQDLVFTGQQAKKRHAIL